MTKAVERGLLPDNRLFFRCQYDNPTNDVILSGVGADHEMCYFYIMHYSERDGQTAPSSDEFEGFCIDFESIKINDLTSFLGDSGMGPEAVVIEASQ